MNNKELGEKLSNIGAAFIKKSIRVRAQYDSQQALPYSITGIILGDIGGILTGEKSEEDILAYLNSDILKEETDGSCK